jgi:hypothetical protein
VRWVVGWWVGLMGGGCEFFCGGLLVKGCSIQLAVPQAMRMGMWKLGAGTGRCLGVWVVGWCVEWGSGKYKEEGGGASKKEKGGGGGRLPLATSVSRVSR